MPILTAYALILTSAFSLGFGTAYKLEHSQVTALELQIKVSNEESKNLLVDATEKVEAAEQKALVTNENLETEHAKNIKAISDHANALESARRVWLNNQPRSGCALPKADNPIVDTKDDDGGYWLDSGAISSRVDGLIQKADTLAADHHEVISWLNSIPKELIK